MAKAEFHKRLMDLQDNLLSFALKLTSNYDDAHDLLQDTTCKALVNEQKYVDDSNFRSWVFTIMQDSVIGDNATINNVIIDKDCNIAEGEQLMGAPNYPVYIEKGSVIS